MKFGRPYEAPISKQRLPGRERALPAGGGADLGGIDSGVDHFHELGKNMMPYYQEDGYQLHHGHMLEALSQTVLNFHGVTD